VQYPVSCSPQAWASGTPIVILTALLGLKPDAATGELKIVNPRLPEFLTFLEIRDLRVGKSWLDLDFLRHGDRTSCRVVGRRGEELAVSIRIHGILQPLIVTQRGERYELIAGERRLRAAKLAGLSEVPVIVRSFDEQEKLELAIIENLQRAELNPIETATAFRKLMDQFNLTYDQVGQRVGRDRSTVANTMRLLNLPLEVKRAVSEGRISEGHGRVILSVTEPDKQLELAGLIESRNWSVRQAEEYARGFRGKTGTRAKAEQRISQTNSYTEALGAYLGTKVTQVGTAKGGRLVIEYYSDEELERIYQAIRGEEV